MDKPSFPVKDPASPLPPIMKLRLLATLALLAGASLALADHLHEPEKSSPERKAIMDALRTANFPKQEVVFKVLYLRVHDGWAWVDVSPLDQKGKPVAEGGTQLLHLVKGAWQQLDLSKIPDDPANPLGAQESSPGFVKNLRKIHPEVPEDIFPKHKK